MHNTCATSLSKRITALTAGVMAGTMLMLFSGELLCQTVKPRILILFDTSGSMTFDIDETDLVNGGSATGGDGSGDVFNSRFCCPGEGGSRLRIAKDAMAQMIDSTGDIEFALMKFPQYYYETQAAAEMGSAATWYRYNQVQGEYDILRYQGMAGDVLTDGPGVDSNAGYYLINDGLTGAGEAWVQLNDYVTPGHFDTRSNYLCEAFGSSNGEIKTWFNHAEYNSDGTAISGTGYTSPFGDSTEQELRGDGGTPLGEAVDAAYAYLSEVMDADPKKGCRPYYLLILADGDFDGVINPITGQDDRDSLDFSGSPALFTGYFGVDDLYALGVETWVIGLAAASDTLDYMADAGGCHYGDNAGRAPRTSPLHSAGNAVNSTECDTPGHAYLANSKASLSTILANIISSAILIEECNYLDDDCDGLVDEGVGGAFCDLHGATLPWNVTWDTDSNGENYPVWIETDTDGDTDAYSNPNWDAVCEDPGERYCDGLDDNCNGQIDEVPSGGWSDVHNPDMGDACISVGDTYSTSIPAHYDVSTSQCKSGKVECIPGNGLECIGDVGPSAEKCDGIDNDCDGDIDEGENDTDTALVKEGVSCGSSVGECEAGELICIDGNWECTATWGSTEECDGTDNDCDGLTDETFPSKGNECYSDSDGDAATGCFDTDSDGAYDCNGICAAGALACESGGIVCVGAITPSGPDNTCNGIDDNCNGQTDEGVNNTADCPAGSGTWTTISDNPYSKCNAGTLQCNSSIPEMQCVGDNGNPVVYPAAEICDGYDNDCDNSIDEGLTESCGGCEVGVDTDYDCIDTDPGAGRCTVGTRSCNAVDGAGTASFTACEGDVGPTAEICNNLDDDCDGEVDEDLSLGSCYPSGLSGCSEGVCVGACSLGTYVCTNGILSCEGYVKPTSEGTVCNNRDDNCNGQIDEGITNACGDAIDTEQYPGAAYGQGLCRLGIQYCSADTDDADTAAFGPCNGAQGPKAELCNGLDDDCDGKYEDEEDSDLAANVSDSLVGAPCGSCDGIYMCEPDTDKEPGQMGAYGLECVGNLPGVEICNGKDENCNDINDDGIDPVSCGGCVAGVDTDFDCVDTNPAQGECATGLNYCIDGAMTTECYGSVGPVVEVCDGLDNDCDGSIDEDFNDMADVVCQVAMGECPMGIQQCVAVVDGEIVTTGLHCCDATEWNDSGDCVTPRIAQEEVCDGRDNDCDGSIDEDLATAGEACGQTLGICEPGVYQCVADSATGAYGIVCVGGSGGAAEECNSIDDDCDGLVDEELPPGDVCSKTPNWMSDPALQIQEPNGIGECSVGNYECISGEWICNVPGPTDEVCDGLDNDCDGLIDEDEQAECPSAGSVCIEGECAEPCGDGEFTCPSGKECITLETGDRVCMSTICDKTRSDALPCVFNEYYCTPGHGFEPTCTCDPLAKMCVDICYNKTCDEGEVCVPSDNGRCHPENEGCMVTGCEEGQTCVEIAMCTAEPCQECVPDPCASVVCDDGQYCSSEGVCTSTCENVECPAGQGCEDGVCVADACADVRCTAGVVCNPATGLCDASLTNPCKGITCEFYQYCEDGACVFDECVNVECPNGTECYRGSCYAPGATTDTDGSPLTADTDSSAADTDTATDSGSVVDTAGNDTSTSTGEITNYEGIDTILAAGSGGCMCSTAVGSGGTGNMGWLVALFGALLAAIRLRLFRRMKRIAPGWWITRGSILLLLLFLMGCSVEPFRFQGADDNDSGTMSGGGTGGAGSDDSGIDSSTDTRTDTNDTAGGTDTNDTSLAGGTDTDSSGAVGDCSECGTDEECCQNQNGNQFCVNLKNNPYHCGACNAQCSISNASAICEDGSCKVAACATYYYDQNSRPDDGCEYYCQPTADVEDGGDKCDGIALSADPDNDDYSPLDNDCDFEFDEDVDFLNDPKNCGYCGNLCLFNHAGASCVNGVCTMGDCDARWWDMANGETDGCEYYCDGSSAAVETCDNLDNNCNGQVDEGNPGGGGPCYPAGSAGCTDNGNGTFTCMGACQAGVWLCSGGNLVCSGYRLPATEVCDGLDNNCNGQVDEALRISCGGAPGINPNTGVCQQGLAACSAVAAADGSAGLPVYDTDSGCVGEVAPGVERCDNLDNDCDGLVDETATDDANANNITINDESRLGQACGLGACAVFVTQCISGKISCEDFTPASAEIACNNIDDDCDGQVDEVATYQCGGSEGVVCNDTDNGCDAYSEGICQVGTYSCDDTDGCAGDVRPSCSDTEHCDDCDGEDNDCDGLVDEDAFYGYSDTDMNCGAPCNDGKLTCIDGAISCVGANTTLGPELCDGADNDCDAGTRDGSAETNFEGPCDRDDDADECAAGVYRCAADGSGMYCDEKVEYTEICDGIDNDCDGQIDEAAELTPPADPVTFGCNVCPSGTLTEVVCDGANGWRCRYDGTATGTVDCDGDAPCFTLLTQETRCDIIDNDCDGVEDDDFDLNSDFDNCGGCGNVCMDLLADTDISDVGSFRCVQGECEISACTGNYRDANLDVADGCECLFNTAACGNDLDNPAAGCDKCWGSSGYGDDNCDNVPNDAAASVEQMCDGIDNDCDGAVDLLDDDLSTNDAPDVCASKCVESGHAVISCNGDTADTDEDWECTYDTAVELSGGVPVSAETLCDGLDNDCDGFVDESLPMDNAQYLGAACDNSDDSDPFSQGACILSGTWRCAASPTAAAVCCVDTDSDATCANVIQTPSQAVVGRVETLNGVDDDCDGLIDETISDTDTSCISAVAEIDFDTDGTADYSIFAYEASRWNAGDTDAGSGNVGVACARPGAIPWTGVTLTEAEAACNALGDGSWSVCSAGQWQYACQQGDAAASTYPYGDIYQSQYCNGIDYTTVDGLIPAGDLADCLTSWGTTDIFDMSGNAEEWTSTETSSGSGVYQIRGGSWNDQQDGLTCTFDLWAASGDSFKLDNLGFRCCKGDDPDNLCGSIDCSLTIPANECVNGGATLRQYDGNHSCYAGQCTYSYVDIACPQGGGCITEYDTDGNATQLCDIDRENWEMFLAVDDQFDLYFGTPTSADSHVLRGDEWYTVYTCDDVVVTDACLGHLHTDYLYVVTASNFNGAQGFLGYLVNTSLNKATTTGDDIWEVFPAGAYLTELQAYAPDDDWDTGVYAPWESYLEKEADNVTLVDPPTWDAGTVGTHDNLPHELIVNAAIGYAQENNLWVTPYMNKCYNNTSAPSTCTDTDGNTYTYDPWGGTNRPYDGIPGDPALAGDPLAPEAAYWIWHDSGRNTAPSRDCPGAFEGFNHDEFLIFRVAGAITSGPK